MAEIVEGFGTDERQRIAGLRREGRFFWLDASLTEMSKEDLGEALGVPEHAMRPLLDFDPETPPSRQFHADGQHVVFGFSCYIEMTGRPGEVPGLPDEVAYRLRPVEVHVLVSGEYLLTVHEEHVSLPDLLPAYSQEGRSEQYVVYAILDAMTATVFDALHEAEQALEGLQVMSTDLGGARVRMGTLRTISARLSDMRRRVGPHRGIFERISEEIGQVEGLAADNERYFERIYEQLNRLISAIDATSDSLAKLIDLRLNETIYWLTVVATIFLPLTFITGFFGMNFAWMVGKVTTPLAFFLLGIGTPVVGVAVTYLLIQRRGTPVQPDKDTMGRIVSAVRRPRA
jgi:magnesium transporter